MLRSKSQRSHPGLSRVLPSILLLVCLFVPRQASARDADWETVVSLASAALGNDVSALETLREVTSIEGTPTDMKALLEDEEKLYERLSAISILGATPRIDTEAVESAIAEILTDPAFPTHEVSFFNRILGPVSRFLARIRAWTHDFWGRIQTGLYDILESTIGFFSRPLNAFIGLLAIGIITAVAAFFLGRKRAREIERQATIRRILDMGTNPRELERLALEAAKASDYSEAIRLWFVAGLLHLDAEGRIDFAPGVPNGVFAEKIASPAFDRLNERFNQVVYGKETSTESDWTAVRSDWDYLRREQK